MLTRPGEPLTARSPHAPRMTPARWGLALAMGALVVAGGCASGGEVVVVDAPPRTAEPGASPVEAPTAETPALRRGADDRLRIAEAHPIHSFDPLFAHSPAELRAVALLYEPLFRIASDGTVVPALVSEWRVEDDGLSYTFELREDRYFHDSPIFANGRGKRVSSVDVRLMVIRAANPNVPGRAAELLRGVRGFDLFASEQALVKNPELRVTRSIDGVRILGPSTIRFQLDRADPDFLRKLASPILSVYPREAFLNGSGTLHGQPVGTGFYSLTSHSDSLTILDPVAGAPTDGRDAEASWRRVELLTASTTATTLADLRSAGVDWIPEAEAWGIAPGEADPGAQETEGWVAGSGTGFEAFLYRRPAGVMVALDGDSAGTGSTDTLRAAATDDPRLRNWLLGGALGSRPDATPPLGCQSQSEPFGAQVDRAGIDSPVIVITPYYGPVTGVDLWTDRIDPFHAALLASMSTASHVTTGDPTPPVDSLQCAGHSLWAASPELPSGWAPAAPWHIPSRTVAETP